MASTSSKLSGKTRKLKVTLSEGTEQIEREVTEKQLSNRTKRRKNYAKEAAVPAWSEFGHTGLFMLTIIICGLLFAYPRLRDGPRSAFCSAQGEMLQKVLRYCHQADLEPC